MVWPGLIRNRMRHRVSPVLLLFVASMALAAPHKRFEGGPWQHGDPSLPQPADEDHARCRALGGAIGPITRQWSHCVYPALDAGVACSDARDCEGSCVAAPQLPAGTATGGRCSAQVNAIGCVNLVIDGSALGFRCVD